MKKILLISLSFLFTSVLMAQQDKLQKMLAADTILNQVYQHLPTGWQMSVDDTCIVVFRTGKYAFVESDCGNLTADSLDKLPRTETALIRFLYEEKWGSERLFWTRETNDSINILLGFLPQQMGVAHLLDKDKSTRFNQVYTGKTKAEKDKVAAFYKRKNELNRQITSLPNYNTTLYSLRQRQQTGMQRPGNCVYPRDVYKEVLGVNIVLMDYCENPLSR